MNHAPGDFNDKCQKMCLLLYASDRLDNLDLKDQIIAIFYSLELQFFLFDNLTRKYFSRCKVTIGADQTVGIIEDIAQEYITKTTWLSAIIKIVKVVEVLKLKVPL